MEQSVVVVSAVRTPLGRRDGDFSEVHPTVLLGSVQRAAVDRAGIDMGLVGQVIGGVVAQVGEQSFNATRTAWLAQGLPQTVAATTVDAQCGSSQQTLTLATGLIASGITDVAMACGVESMTRLPIGSNFRKDFGLGRPVPKAYREHYEFLNQFQAAERIARAYDIERDRADARGLLSQERAGFCHGWGRPGDDAPRPARRRPRAARPPGFALDDLDLVEINEAFASVVLSFEDELKVDPERVNPNGGAIALGHPLGATGCVLVTKAVHELARTNARYGLVTMCCGGGLGTATILERL